MSNVTVDITENITQVTATINETTQAVTVEVTTTGAQPTNANLTALSGLTGAADKVPYFTGVGAMALATLTSYGRSIIAIADRAGLLTLLGLTTADIPQDSTHRFITDTEKSDWNTDIETLQRNSQGAVIIDMGGDDYTMTEAQSQHQTIFLLNTGAGKTCTLFDSVSNPALITIVIYSETAVTFSCCAGSVTIAAQPLATYQLAYTYTTAVELDYARRDSATGQLIDPIDASLITTGTIDTARIPTLNQNTTGSAATLTTARTIDGVSFDGSANITVIAPSTHAATSKTTPVGADEIPLVDSAASNVLKKLTWSNLKATLKTYFDTIYKPYITPSGTYATMVALSSPSVGQQFICTDCNNSTWTYNGAAWKPVGGKFLLWASTVASGVAPSGTINTGSSGNITFGTALDKPYAYGVFLELPAVATTPAIAAGKYYCVMTSTTVGTIYATSWSGNVPTIGAAINFSAGTTYTGITTRIVCYTATSLPGNVMGLGGSVVLEYSASIKNNANNKVYSVAWGSVSGLGGNGNTNIAGYAGAVMMITNMGDTSHQTYTPNPMTIPASMGVPGGSAQDTTTAKTVSIGVAMAVATDYYIFQQLNVWVVVP